MTGASTLTAEAGEIARTAALIPHDSLEDALVAALSELTVVHAGRTAKVEMKQGGSFSYDYADIADVVKMTRPILAKHGLVALTPIHDHPQGLACRVLIVWAGGETLDLGSFPFPAGRDAQTTGSAVTYHRRYSLVAALGMAAGDDDDGAAATKASREPAPVVWNRGMVKAALAEIFSKADPDAEQVVVKARAAEAWRNGGGDDLTEFSRAAAERLHAQWLGNQPAEGDPDA